MRKLAFGVSLAGLVILFHQVAQIWVFGLIKADGPHIEVLPFFNLVKVWNRGISFGMFNDLPHGQWLLSATAIIIVFVLALWLWRSKDSFTIAALALVIGGAVGNTIDRLRFGAVADYLDFHAFGHHWPAFNMTDTAIFVGVGLLLLRRQDEHLRKS
jgi:signal peptidase II